ncbi:Ger(x)C family spore germination protein [Caloramator proteoclasticus]|uniref:Germination protein, Ger(X)C family n=1 Tax=Caloramator proteoclasticus DSM 10124 TaxID=1121262 RepID=A0A1M4TQM8_9CLOT|nr:Ger(x)C family spore germination protein [Caloramator proteoclasticus]SHE46761.1 germination protein, Ger(x)C family [Caloramator proteoclasticus DSM 10124]
MKRNVLIILLIALTTFTGCYEMEPIENLSIIIGIGYDVQKEGQKKIVDPIEMFVFKGDGEVERLISPGIAETIYNTINDRQTVMSKKFLVGTEKLYLISREWAEYGIEDLLDTLVRNENRNEIAYVCITEGDTKHFFSMVPIDNTSMSEAISGILKFSYLANFFPKEVTIKELLFMYHQTGRRIILPYIVDDKGKPKIAGICVFDGAKLKHIIPLEEAFYINMIRSRKSDGYISIIKDNNPKICYTIKAKNYVNVEVDYDDKLIYTINITLKGNLKTDTIHNTAITAKEAKEIERTFEEYITEQLNKTIEKVQNKYKIDCFDITKYAAAKLGKHSPLLTDEEFQRAQINVKVKVILVDLGRSMK